MEPKQGLPKSPYEGAPSYSGEWPPLNGGDGERLDERHFEAPADSPARQEQEALPPVIPVAPVAIPVMSDNSAQSVAASDDNSTNPALAADDDLIEKEWVDKAKKIIEATKEDPYKRELEIGKLQRDYILKRYGRSIGESGGA